MARVLDRAQHNAFEGTEGGGAALLNDLSFVLGSTFQKPTTIQSARTTHLAKYSKQLPQVCRLIHLAEAVSGCWARESGKDSPDQISSK